MSSCTLGQRKQSKVLNISYLHFCAKRDTSSAMCERALVLRPLGSCTEERKFWEISFWAKLTLLSSELVLPTLCWSIFLGSMRWSRLLSEEVHMEPEPRMHSWVMCVGPSPYQIYLVPKIYCALLLAIKVVFLFQRCTSQKSLYYICKYKDWVLS